MKFDINSSAALTIGITIVVAGLSWAFHIPTDDIWPLVAILLVIMFVSLTLIGIRDIKKKNKEEKILQEICKGIIVTESHEGHVTIKAKSKEDLDILLNNSLLKECFVGDYCNPTIGDTHNINVRTLIFTLAAKSNRE